MHLKRINLFFNPLVMVRFDLIVKELSNRLSQDVMVRVEDLPGADVCHLAGLSR